MILVDTSAWIELIRGTGSPVNVRLRDALGAESPLATTGPVRMELLAGVRTPLERESLRRMLAACELISVRNESDWDDAAGIYASCRRAGVTVRDLIDCLLAAVAIRAGAVLLTRDRDFERIAEHAGLELAA